MTTDPYRMRYVAKQDKWIITSPYGPVGLMPAKHARTLVAHLNRAFGLGAEWIVKKRARRTTVKDGLDKALTSAMAPAIL